MLSVIKTVENAPSQQWTVKNSISSIESPMLLVNDEDVGRALTAVEDPVDCQTLSNTKMES